MAGVFISLDGVDGGGKSTQVAMLADHLRQQGKQVSTFRDPGGTKLGEALRDILLHRQEIPLSSQAEMLLYMASRAQLVEESIRPALLRGETVITDRYLLANVVYQGSAGGLDPKQIWSVGKVATGGLYPDLTILLDIAPDVAIQRIDRGLDRLESRGLEYMNRVRNGFLDQAKQLTGEVKILDASVDIETLQRQISQTVDAVYSTLLAKSR